jgi:hypothetical protein
VSCLSHDRDLVDDCHKPDLQKHTGESFNTVRKSVTINCYGQLDFGSIKSMN